MVLRCMANTTFSHYHALAIGSGANLGDWGAEVSLDVAGLPARWRITPTEETSLRFLYAKSLADQEPIYSLWAVAIRPPGLLHAG